MTGTTTPLTRRPTWKTMGQHYRKVRDRHLRGLLAALGEHSVFTQGVIRGIDSFDQWGEEPAKVLAHRIAPELEAAGGPDRRRDNPTNPLICRYRRMEALRP
jgi:hypothetical protein